MWSRRGLEYTSSAPFSLRQSHLVDSDFQLRYTLIIVGAAALGVISVTGPIYYLVNQNYKIFFDLAFDTAPDLLENLARERVWINSILLSAFIGLVGFFTFLGLRMTNRIIGPLKVLKNHLKLLSRGHWKQRQIKIRNQDEFQDLINAYNYFYGSFRANMQKELDLLKKISVEEERRDAHHAWMELMALKASQLGSEELNQIQGLKSLRDEKRGPSPESRHAS